MRVAVPNTCPSWADLLDHLIVVLGSGGFLDAAFGFVLLAVDAPGIDPQQHVDAVTGPLSDLRCGHSGVQPGGDRRVPQIIGAPGQQRRPFLADEGGGAGLVEDLEVSPVVEEATAWAGEDAAVRARPGTS